MASSMFASICIMNTLKEMSPNELVQTKERLAPHNIAIYLCTLSHIWSDSIWILEIICQREIGVSN